MGFIYISMMDQYFTMPKKTSIKVLIAIIFPIMALFSHQALALTNQQAEQKYQQALQFNKTGNAELALPILSDLIISFPQVKRYFFDYILTLLWAGKDQKIMLESHKIDFSTAPDYVLESVARAARNQKKFVQAENLYRQLIARHPSSLPFQLGLARILIDQKKTTSAKKLLDKLTTFNPDNIGIMIVRAYAEERDGDYLAAAELYEYILQLKPDHKPAVKGLVFALSANKAYGLAYQKAEQNRVLFSDEQWVKLNWDLAATYIRWGEIPSKKLENRYDETDHAIALIDKNLKMLGKMQLANKKLWQSRAQFDLIVALRDRKRMQHVLDQYNALQQQSVILPAYAKIAVADAFLYLEQPQQARDLYLQVLQEIPNSYNARQSLVYAYLESEQLDLANELAKQLAKQQPDKIWFKSPKGNNVLYSRGNPRKTETELAKVVIIAFSDRLDAAYQNIEKLYNNASFNADIGNVRANIHYYRGWPRQARKQLIAALNIEPKHVGLKTSVSRVLHELREYPEEQINTESLYQQYPENKGAQKQKRLWNIHNKRELKVFTNGGFSTGAAQGSESISLDSFLYSQPLDYNYRVFTHFRWQTGLFLEGRGYFRRYGMGLEYAIPDLIATAEVHYDNFDKSSVGFQANVNYQFDDYWSAAIDFDSRSDDISLRALKNGVTAKAQQLSVSYRVHESRQFTMNQQFFDYSDDNERFAISATYFERWISGPIYKFSTFLNAGYFRNSKTNVPYFSPANDFSTSLTLDNDVLTYRHYDLAFNQRVALTIGNHWQEDHGSNPVGQILYEHRWKAQDQYELVYGGIRGYPIYDGVREETWQFYLNLNVRF